jgi:hypothetical protein
MGYVVRKSCIPNVGHTSNIALIGPTWPFNAAKCIGERCFEFLALTIATFVAIDSRLLTLSVSPCSQASCRTVLGAAADAADAAAGIAANALRSDIAVSCECVCNGCRKRCKCPSFTEFVIDRSVSIGSIGFGVYSLFSLGGGKRGGLTAVTGPRPGERRR